MQTVFTTTQDGGLQGTYHVPATAQEMGFDGRLDGFRVIGACRAQFTWHDRYGSGGVVIEFLPDDGKFLGYWGDPVPNAFLIFDGFRNNPKLLS